MRLSSILIAVAVLIAVGLFVFRNSFGGDAPVEMAQEAQAEVTDQRISVLAMRSAAQEVTSGIILRGETSASKTIAVKAETQGAVISQPLRKGAFVAKDQLLCELEIGTKSADVAEAKARLAEAEANNQASANLVKKGFASETTAISREAALESAMANLERAEKALADTKIVAPFDGFLETDTAELGDFLQPGALCATVLSLDPIKLTGFATEVQVSRIQKGASAGARLIDGREIFGNVTFVSRSSDPITRTFLVEVEVNNNDLTIRDGSSADIFIALSGAKGHLIPQSSLTLNDTGTLGVRVAEDGVAHFKPVTIIRDDKDGMWVEGLGDTADVIVLGQEYVTDGTEINVTFEGEG
ncbi:MAG: efflux RND transporter periplasmic adaptor subunit [Pseudomonadota bacterium]